MRAFNRLSEISIVFTLHNWSEVTQLQASEMSLHSWFSTECDLLQKEVYNNATATWSVEYSILVGVPIFYRNKAKEVVRKKVELVIRLTQQWNNCKIIKLKKINETVENAAHIKEKKNIHVTETHS